MGWKRWRVADCRDRGRSVGINADISQDAVTVFALPRPAELHFWLNEGRGRRYRGGARQSRQRRKSKTPRSDFRPTSVSVCSAFAERFKLHHNFGASNL